MKKGLISLAVILLVVSIPAAIADDGSNQSKAQKKRAKIDTIERETLATLFGKSPKATELYGKAHGHAVFSNLKISLGLTGGGGAGVAVEKKGGRRTYMRMGTAGLNLGLGAHKYQVVFLFQDSKTFRDFIEHGWQADAGANAVAGKAGANAETTFTNGIAYFQLTQGGLMLQADISGTKYWKYKKLN
ncbi:MAG: hypothetical protein O7A63_05250 [Acidobacteria bacterium]|nr:hypothetical protein [Acidobacteriota bacterium]